MTETKRYAALGMVAALALGLCLLAPAKPAPALSTADQPSAILVWPSIQVNLAYGIDTRLQLVNHDLSPKLAHCFYIDATRDGQWIVTDFFITLTSHQPVSWLASEGLRGPLLNTVGNIGICLGPSGNVCTSSAQCGGLPCVFGQNNNGTAVPPVNDPFKGALKCVQVDPEAEGGPRPDTENSLTGMAGIVRGRPELVKVITDSEWTSKGPDPDIQKYSAIGLKSIAEHPDDVLQLGGEDAEYEGCPSTLIVNHLFDDATNPLELVPLENPLDNPYNRTVHTFLTLIPCSDDFLRGIPGSTTAQYLVFNEFEQRYSTSTRVECVEESKLSSIDVPYGGDTKRSIWSAFVSGTIVGQTRIQGVGSNRGLLGVARLMNGWYESFADYNVHQQGDKPDGDTLVVP